jgi:hypothetical protein
MKRDLVCGIIMLVLAICYCVMAAAIPRSGLADAVGPQGLPTSYAIVLAILSLLLIGTNLTGRGVSVTAALTAAKASARSDRYAALRAGGMLLIGICYVVALPWLGYVVSITMLIVATAWYLEKGYRKWMLPIAVLGAVAFWLIFVEILEIPQPAGLWPSLI